MKHVLKLGVILFSIILSQCYASNPAPEIATRRTLKPLVSGREAMIVTNNPYASSAAKEILLSGGNAFDAAIAAGFVLGLTEPQSSGIGGGGYALTLDGKSHRMLAYDGREIAPRIAHANWFIDSEGNPLPFREAQLSVKSIGVPGEVMLFYSIHRKQGQLSWKKLLQPAIRLAQHGYKMSQRLHDSLLPNKILFHNNHEIRNIYFNGDHIKKIGSRIVNTEYAMTLKRIAEHPLDFYQGELASEIIDTINQQAEQKYFSRNDFSSYQVHTYSPVCSRYREKYRLCSLPPSDSGGVTVQMLMGIYANRYDGKNVNDPQWSYVFLEASKLAFADRDQYLADPDFVNQPISGLLNKNYLKQRSQLIHSTALLTPVAAGKPDGIDEQYAPDSSFKSHGTTSMAIIDKFGNAISLTATIESGFGSHFFTHGFFLNNELTDFSFKPKDDAGKWVANRVQPGKRPRSSMAPMFVFDRQSRLVAISGSPGGNEIICYVAKSLILMLDMKLKPDQASREPNICSLNDDSEIENVVMPVSTIDYLHKKGEKLQFKEMTSGIVNISRDPTGGWLGAADPRREGVAIGLPSH